MADNPQRYEMVDGELRPMSSDTAADIAAGRADAGDNLPDISDRQFARGLWGAEILTYEEFLGFIGPGNIPATMLAIIDTLPDDDSGNPTPRKDAMGFLTGSKLFEFNHPLVEVFRQYMVSKDPIWTEGYLKNQWRSWALL